MYHFHSFVFVSMLDLFIVPAFQFGEHFILDIKIASSNWGINHSDYQKPVIIDSFNHISSFNMNLCCTQYHDMITRHTQHKGVLIWINNTVRTW